MTYKVQCYVRSCTGVRLHSHPALVAVIDLQVAMHQARHAARGLPSLTAVLLGVLLSLGVPACTALRIGIASYEPGAPVLAQNLTLGQIGWQLQVPVPVSPCGAAQTHHKHEMLTQTQPSSLLCRRRPPPAALTQQCACTCLGSRQRGGAHLLASRIRGEALQDGRSAHPGGAHATQPCTRVCSD